MLPQSENQKNEKEIFWTKYTGAVESGGKVLIPVFALGRAQELCILLPVLTQMK
jgi:integrator complex subunit 11